MYRWWKVSGRGTALALVELGAVGLFAAGVVERVAGSMAPWYLLVAVVVGFAVRAIDLEGCALFLSGGSYGAARQAFGTRASVLAAAMLLTGYAVFGALAASAAGRALLAGDDMAPAIGVAVIGAVWWWLRQGRTFSNTFLERATLAVAGAIAVALACGAIALVFSGPAGVVSAASWFRQPRPSLLAILTAASAALFVVGSPEAFTHAASDFPPPRIRRLRQGIRVVNVATLVLVAGVAFLFVLLIPPAARAEWTDAPMAGLVLFTGAPQPIAVVVAVAVSLASALFLAVAVHRSAVNAQRLLLRLAEDGILIPSMRALHPRFGTPSRLIDLVAVAQIAAVLAGAGQLSWLARATGMLIACTAILKIIALIRMRTRRQDPRAFRVPGNVRIAGREWPIGLGVIAAGLAVPALFLIATADAAAVIAMGCLAAVTLLLTASEQVTRTSEATAPAGEIDLLPAPSIGIDHVEVAPGGVLVPLRRPGALAPLAAALQDAGPRDVVAMTVRLTGVDVSDDRSRSAEPTDDERRLFTAAALMAERLGHAIRLVIVPASNVSEAVAQTAARLRVSDIHVGESETLAADDQARLLGEAWERTPHPMDLDVRLVIHHSSGRTAVYHIGAHAPSLSSDDLNLIHAIWLDAVKSVGPHVHHRDVVRAALTHMQEQLSNDGPPRESALDMIRRTAHPAEELAAVVQQRDFGRLRDIVRNRPASDIAAALTGLSTEDQVVAFRVLPRKVAAETFEYLSLDAQRSLVKAMAQEDVAGILNNMAPDDRTTFLEELPASVTQQLLTLLTPEERATAVTLLGYPEGSIGRLMTPDYIAVREQWTIQQVLDYIREHGQDSETLNVIYVVDDRGVLIDDIRIREFLLTSPGNKVADLMDRRFVALSAADSQSSAVAIFRREDRLALPVTDSTGVLIGIVTIDDVIVVAEQEATADLQRVGGSEALDEPYMKIAFSRMIQKRAGWLTALFLGEMLTATAMGAFQREIERAVVLALFIPLIISSGGNSGSQASTLVIRAIALGEVKLRDWWRVARREIGAGLALGSILGSIGFLRITIWSAFSTIYGEHWLLVAITVAFALVGVVLWGTIVGSLLPFLLRRLGFDPATSSAPFVATLVDVTGLIIYFSVGLLVLHGTLLKPQ
jgi:magnesium transporter